MLTLALTARLDLIPVIDVEHVYTSASGKRIVVSGALVSLIQEICPQEAPNHVKIPLIKYIRRLHGLTIAETMDLIRLCRTLKTREDR